MKDQIQKAIDLRNEKQHADAIQLLKSLLADQPKNPDINYQIAWTYDSMGHESEAAQYYETAISYGITEDRKGCFLGLGSTYRCLGEYKKSLTVFDQGIKEFPDDRSLKVFRALTLYNLGKSEESVSQLLVQLIDTTADESIKSYGRALRFYSDKLNETWK